MIIIRRSLPAEGREGHADSANRSPILSAALEFAARGIPVFPCQPDGKAPATTHGFKDATTDLQQIKRWWTDEPAANLAMPTGAATWNVLDVDVRGNGDGRVALHHLGDSDVLPTNAGVVTTPSGGCHIYFQGTDEPSRRLSDHFLDWKAEGGYVLLPPSRVGGREYTWLIEQKPESFPLSWDEVTEVLGGPPTQQCDLSRGTPIAYRSSRRLEPLVRHILGSGVGQRNSRFFWAACRALEDGYRDLSPLISAGLSVGLTVPELRSSTRSAYRAVGIEVDS